MKKILILIVVVSALFSGCVGQQKIVKVGDNISIDYIGRTEDGKIFDTSIGSVAKQNGIFVQGGNYIPLKFKVGNGEVIEGLDQDVIGMRVGDNRTFTVPPEKGYGPIDPSKITVIPIIQNIPNTLTFPRIIEVPAVQFEMTFGFNHSTGNDVRIPDSNINLTVKNIGTNVSLAYNLTVGETIVQKGAPWNRTVLSISNTSVTLKEDAEKNSVVKLQNAPWNSTVVDVNSTNITLKHNYIPDTEVPGQFGNVRVHFNETSIIVDQNSILAGKTLIFDVTLKSID